MYLPCLKWHPTEDALQQRGKIKAILKRVIAANNRAALAISMLLCIYKYNNHDWKCNKQQIDNEQSYMAKMLWNLFALEDGLYPAYTRCSPKIRPPSSFRSQCTVILLRFHLACKTAINVLK